jgi:RNA polymerase sigma-70 factor, ECF subfamily
MNDAESPTSASFACVAAAWEAHERELLGYLQHRLADAHEAEDVLQDVFVKALRQGQGFCAIENPRAWLFRVVRTTLIDRLRASHPEVTLTPEMAEAIPQTSEPLPPVDALAECLARTLAELPGEDAAILSACDLGGQTQRAFAQAQGLSLPAVKSRLLRARQRLRDRLTQVCQVRFDADGDVDSHVPRPPRSTPGSAPSSPSPAH